MANILTSSSAHARSAKITSSCSAAAASGSVLACSCWVIRMVGARGVARCAAAAGDQLRGWRGGGEGAGRARGIDITRLYNSVDEKKHATTAAKKALKSAQQHAGAKEKEKDKRIDEVMGKVQKASSFN